ncbi:hypothetical protein F511_35551 [Dorcoceras hygrometricum]|uniref:Uncharacterized protein n=1 Tax=Dorcoceras hygrometricum TaxID=472368 RepID=A0A2Z7D9P5_9LAMI|nr:hypothetical protein F511_35551 [Dorcoceras hygrometricum]
MRGYPMLSEGIIVYKSLARLIGGRSNPVVDLIRRNLPPPTVKCRFPRETGRSQAPRRQQDGIRIRQGSPTIHACKRAVNPRQRSIDSYMHRDLTQSRRLMNPMRTNQYNQDLGLINSTIGNHLESPNEGSSIDHQVTIHLHAQNITMFPTINSTIGVAGNLAGQSGASASRSPFG